MKFLSHIQPVKFLGVQYPPIDHVQNSWAYNTHQLITCEIPGCTAGNHATITCHHVRGVLCTHIIPGYGLTFAHMLTYLQANRHSGHLNHMKAKHPTTKESLSDKF